MGECFLFLKHSTVAIYSILDSTSYFTFLQVELLAEEKQNLEKELSETKSKADDHSNKVKELTLSFEDAQEELRVLKKKNAQQVKVSVLVSQESTPPPPKLLPDK